VYLSDQSKRKASLTTGDLQPVGNDDGVNAQGSTARILYIALAQSSLRLGSDSLSSREIDRITHRGRQAGRAAVGWLTGHNSLRTLSVGMEAAYISVKAEIL